MDESIRTYIDSFTGVTHERLEQLYALITAIVPDAQQKISYGVPTFYVDAGPIVYFAGYKDFVSIYPVHQAPKSRDVATQYLHGKSTARFSHDKPLPVDDIRTIVQALADLKLHA